MAALTDPPKRRQPVLVVLTSATTAAPPIQPTADVPPASSQPATPVADFPPAPPRPATPAADVPAVPPQPATPPTPVLQPDPVPAEPPPPAEAAEAEPEQPAAPALQADPVPRVLARLAPARRGGRPRDDNDDWPEPDWSDEAERYAIIYPDRARLIRQLGGLPSRCDFGPPETKLLRAIIAGSTPHLLALDAPDPVAEQRLRRYA